MAARNRENEGKPRESHRTLMNLDSTLRELLFQFPVTRKYRGRVWKLSSLCIGKMVRFLEAERVNRWRF